MDSTNGFRNHQDSRGECGRSSDEAEPLLARNVLPESNGDDGAYDALDLYTPLRIDVVPPEARECLKTRALVVGIMLGSLVNASNLYLSLKTGLGFPASTLGAILGYGIMKPLSRTALPLLGGDFGARENSII
ncbi:hypothetical protein TOPH_08477 [Tolypocladium ophioglossoides CBS 100239]|uniref:Uncharacterized protein n=1 Tax=Tolypocladium ophioglossoides (strain CBS 100239) TaxID=1163406 RepID=A0A0L0MYL6_TOLOC|nr:hypothetical protein TOPH_08477 [Tolypocladium ophioglossoides CBS 100239]